MHRVYGNKRKRSEEIREIADNSDDVVELETSYELERLGAPVQTCGQPAARRERFDHDVVHLIVNDVPCPLVIYDR